MIHGFSLFIQSNWQEDGPHSLNATLRRILEPLHRNQLLDGNLEKSWSEAWLRDFCNTLAMFRKLKNTIEY